MLVFTGESTFQGLLGGANGFRPSTVGVTLTTMTFRPNPQLTQNQRVIFRDHWAWELKTWKPEVRNPGRFAATWTRHESPYRRALNPLPRLRFQSQRPPKWPRLDMQTQEKRRCWDSKVEDIAAKYVQSVQLFNQAPSNTFQPLCC